METHPIGGENGDHLYAFEIENVYIAPRTIARMLRKVQGVEDVRSRTPFSRFDGVHVRFKYAGQNFIVCEPFGDSSRYWVGPENDEAGTDIRALERIFQRYRPPLFRRIFGDILSLRIFKRLVGRT